MSRGTVPLLWSYGTYRPVFVVERVGPMLIAPVRRTQLAALDLHTGAERWRARHASPNPWDIAVTLDHVFTHGLDLLQAFDLATGERAWEITVPAYSGWLHAGHGTVLIGGWRGYTRLQAYDTHTGALRWTVPLPEIPLRTAIYEPLRAAVVVFGSGLVRWLDLRDGTLLHEMELPGLDPGQQMDILPKNHVGQPGAALLLKGAGTDLYRLGGPQVTVERLSLKRAAFTSVLREQAGEVFFHDRQQLWVHDLERDQTRKVGELSHHAAKLRVVRAADGSVLAGTSFGRLVHFGPDGGVLGAVTVGRRIETDLHMEGNQVAFGTRNGAVMALDWRTLG